MKRVLLEIVFMTVLSVCMEAQVLHYIMKPVNNLVTSQWEKDDSGNSCLNYYNNDFCDYVHLSEGDFKTLRPGKNTIYKRSKGELESPYRYGKKYHLYRGRFLDKKFDPYFVYAFPFKDDAMIRWKLDRREPKRTLLMQCESCDTVYAIRSGVVCTINSGKSEILVYHDDHTFAGYMNLQESLVVPGQKLRTGEPVGVTGNSTMSLTVFFLDKNLFEDGKTIVHPYTHIMPVFRTDQGDVRLEENTVYKAVVDADLITREMSKSERKRFLKNLEK